MIRATIHATCIAIGEAGVLIEGPSGCGKSDLALRLIDRGAMLVSDDYTELEGTGDELTARAPATIAGQIEIRGLGIETVAHRSQVAVALAVAACAAPERMPLPGQHRRLCGHDVPLIALPLLEPSAPIKVERALERVTGGQWT